MATAEDFRAIALSLPGTTAAPHFERTAFRARVIYATLAGDGMSANFAFTPEEQEFKVMLQPDAFAPIANKWGQQGWTVGTLGAMSVDELRAALELVYAHAQPKPKKARQPTSQAGKSKL